MRDASPIHEYIPILVFFAAAAALPIALLALRGLVAPRLDARAERERYGGGVPPVGAERDRLSGRYVLVAMLFLIFEVATLFLLAWSIALARLALLGLLEMLLFIAILVVGVCHAWRNGAFERA